MKDKTKYLFQGLFFLIIGLFFLGLSAGNLITRSSVITIGIIICLAVGIIFIKNSIQEARREKHSNERSLKKKDE